jgi:aminoglycoside phosphotransferase (APT) family kinase protein
MSETAAPPGTIAVRAGDALDAAALVAWLGTTHPSLLPADDAPPPLVLRQYPGGFSNLTYHVQAGDRAWVLRRPPRGVRGGPAHDMHREWRVLSALHPAGIPVPAPVAFCADDAVLGAPFYLMARVDGVVLRGTPPPDFDAPAAAALADTFVRQLAALHALDPVALGLGDLGRPEGYVARQVAGGTKRWHAAHTHDVPAMERIATWLEAHRVPEAGVALLHNDFKYDNLVLDPDDLAHVRAILDWEMATVGCPRMDLGTSLAYWLEPDDPPLLRALGLGVTAAPGSPSRRELVAAYVRATGGASFDPLFHFVYGVFKLAVVAQQIFARHVQGLTSDPRFARLDAVVDALAGMAEGAIASGRIGR